MIARRPSPLAAALVALILWAVALAACTAPAEAHRAYCGHDDLVYRVDGALHKADYRYYGQSAGDHRHYYYHWRWSGGKWRYLHSYSRLCNLWV